MTSKPVSGNENSIDLEKKFRKPIIALSIILPLAVAALFGIRIKGVDLTFLPPIYALINGLTALVLICALVFIKSGKRRIHEILMKIAIGLSCLFLLMYVAYHMTSDSTAYGGTGFLKYVYFFILITHVLLSILVIPFVLFTYVKAIAGNFKGHRKLAKITFPIWLYVAVTGVIVYLMISPFYK